MAKDENKLSKYVRIAKYFEEQINSGEILPGEQLLTESEIAKKFEVSRHTVRLALIELENNGLIYKEQGKGTFCSDKEGKVKRKIVAVITTYISNYIFPFIIRGIEETLSASGYTFMLFNTNNDKQKEAEYLQKVIDYEVQGLIIEPTLSAMDNTNIELYKELDAKNIPYVMLNAKYGELDPAYVIMDDLRGGYVTTKYLLQLGHKDIAGIFKSDDLQGVYREEGFKRALGEAGINVKPGFIGRFSTKDQNLMPYEFVTNLFRRDNKPSAIICYNDLIAVSVLQAVRDEGLKISEDISIIGYDDSGLSVATEVKLTTVRHPKDDMGRKAARFIINMIEEKGEKPFYVYKPELIVRSSTGMK